MSDRAEVIRKLQAMRTEVRGLYVEENTGQSEYSATLTLAGAVDALTFVVIGMLEADGAPPRLACMDSHAGYRCIYFGGHTGNHESPDGVTWA